MTQPNLWLIGISGRMLAFLLQVGWFFRLRGVLPWVAFGLEKISYCLLLLVLYAFSVPEEGGLIAMMLIWFAICSSSSWKSWQDRQPRNHRQGLEEKS